MGMFDYVKCDHPLPDGWGLENDYVGLQTKDFGCDMTTIWITAEGRLLVEDFEYEEVPKAERPYPNDEGILGLAGSLRKVNRRWRDLAFHGDMYFGALEDLKDDYWVESAARRDGGFWQKRYRDHDYIARFTDGQLTSLICDPETMPDDASAGTNVTGGTPGHAAQVDGAGSREASLIEPNPNPPTPPPSQGGGEALRTALIEAERVMREPRQDEFRDNGQLTATAVRKVTVALQDAIAALSQKGETK